ncbi:MAG: alpha/beta fold hydrolase [Terracidiphilus sp.]
MLGRANDGSPRRKPGYADGVASAPQRPPEHIPDPFRIPNGMYVRRCLISTVCVGIVWLALSSLIGVIAMESALHPARRLLNEADETTAREIAVRNHALLTDVAVAASDGIVLHAWLLAPPHGNGDAVILLHGMADNRAGMLGNADLLLRHGFAVLLPDARAHGESGGAIAAYGVKEADDVRRWFEWLEHSLAPRCIDGLGDSMGAAILLQSIAAEPHFCAVVAESAFSSFREASYDRIGQWFGTGPRLGRTLLQPAVDAGFVYAWLKYGVNLELASPENAVAQTLVPILLIHGLADTNLPSRHSERIKARNPAVVLWEPAGAGHCGASTAAPEEYDRRIVSWFEGHRANASGRSI